MDEQQVFLAVLEEAEIAPGIAPFRLHFETARTRRHAARHRCRDIGLDAIERVDGDALALAQPGYQLAVIDRAPPKSRFRHIGVSAEFRYLGEDFVVFHRKAVEPGFGTGGWAAAGGRDVLTSSAHPT